MDCYLQNEITAWITLGLCKENLLPRSQEIMLKDKKVPYWEYYISTHVYVYAYTYIDVCVYIYICIYVYIYIYVYICVCIHIYIYMYICSGRGVVNAGKSQSLLTYEFIRSWGSCIGLNTSTLNPIYPLCSSHVLFHYPLYNQYNTRRSGYSLHGCRILEALGRQVLFSGCRVSSILL